MLTIEQITAAQQAQLNTLFGLGAKAVESAEKVIELNMQASKALLADGVRTGASGRNWASYGDQVEGLGEGALRDLLTDPQTSGGLLISVSADQADEVLATVNSAGPGGGAVVGRVREGAPGVSVVPA